MGSLEVGGKRLLDEDVKSGRDGLPGHRCVTLKGRGDEHGLGPARGDSIVE